jgi:alkylation response protein AidB-like acyl-CoA dehydrogenase
MDFSLTSEQQSLADSVARYCERDYDLVRRHASMTSSEGICRQQWATFAELGWLGAGLDEAQGGFGGGAIENALIMEQAGRALVVEPLISCATIALQTLAALPGSPPRDELITAIVAGEAIVVLAHCEAAAHGQRNYCATAATRSDSGWHLTGTKSLVLGAGVADKLLVTATTEQGCALFVIGAQSAGLQRHDYRLVDNHRAADLVLTNVNGGEPLAVGPVVTRAIDAGLDHGLIGLCAEAVGLMDLAIATTRDYLKARRQFGTTLSAFQALQHRMADMLVEAELSRSILYGALSAIDESAASSARTICAMKAVVSSAAIFVGRNAVQLHGGIAITEECVVSHIYRRLYTISRLLGDEDVHLRRLAEISRQAGPR